MINDKVVSEDARASESESKFEEDNVPESEQID